ncbi:MAG: arsenical-resistance protein [Cyanobium sp. LacPavin_0818_WC50_MAG_67_9]|nr:arsenical-resistance protein [Cyanobium sp. LacPavin_0818_WC50_MAG_67_9]
MLPIWILLAMAAGLLLGRFVPGLQALLGAVEVGHTSLPIALGLLLMMYPVLAKVRYGELGHMARDRRLLALTLGLTWGLGPLLMFSLAWLFLPDQPAFRTGLILIGIAPCIAMVLIWIDLAQGNREAAALLVAINSILQVLVYALLGTFYLQILPAWLGLDSQLVRFSFWEIAQAVLIFLGVPLLAGFMTRLIGVAIKGLSDPLQVIQVAIPLLLYFVLMWGIAFAVGMRSGLDYPRTSALAFTAAGNNFELAIAVCISIWGVTSQQALAGVVGPLIEVPVLVSLVSVSLWLKPRFRGNGIGS